MDVTPIQPGVPWARNTLDAARAAFTSRTPDAEYPDGYLGNAQSRRERLFTASNNSRKPSERGVHKGEHLADTDYVWPREFGLLSAIEEQAKRNPKRYVPAGMLLAAKDPGHIEPTQAIDIEALKGLAPRWSTGGPGMGVPVITPGY